MIIKSIVTTFLLLVVYFFCLHANKKIDGQNQWQDNIIKAQQYVYNSSVADNVIVGSSLSCRINVDEISNSFFNLSFGGQNALDGLEILAHCEKFPKRVFIEMNVVDRPAHKSFSQSLFNPTLFLLRKYFFILRDENQPATFWIGPHVYGIGQRLFDPFVGRIVNPIIHKFHFLKNTTDVSTKSSSENFKENLVQRQQQEFNTPFNETLINERFRELTYKVKILQSKGVKVIFFEMPMHPTLEHSIRMNKLRQLFLTYFPASVYSYVKRPDYNDYTTADGIHLDKESAKKFTSWFSQNISIP